MTGNNKTNFSYLNQDGEWPGFRRQGLELLADGSLSLYSLPLFDGQLPDELQAAPDPDGPSGIVVSRDGTIFYTDTAADRIRRIDWCDKSDQPIRCIGGKGDDLTQFDGPRGLFVPDYRQSLFVADSGNNRIQIFDLESMMLVDVWGQQRVDETEPGSQPGLLDSPSDLDGDHKGNVYVVDYGNARVQKFNRAGQVVASFSETAKSSAGLSKPSGIAVLTTVDQVLVFVLDEDKREVFVVDEDGNALKDAKGNPRSFGSDVLQRPLGIAVSNESVFVGDNGLRRVLVFNRSDSFAFAGEAVGYQGPVAALAVDRSGHLLVHSGDGRAPFALSLAGGYAGRGVLWSGAIQVHDFAVTWHRLQAVMTSAGTGAHLRLFVHTSNDRSDRPAVDPGADDSFKDQRWVPASTLIFPEIDSLFIGGPPATFIWVGALISGDGRSTPVLSQLKLEFDHETYLKNLPAIYREASPCGDFLTRFLSLIETLFSGVEGTIESLAAFFDPAVVPGEFLPWLAGWLALELDEDWDENKKRQAIAHAFEYYGRRGTARGLREALRFLAGVNAIVEEPILNAEWWGLPAESSSCECDKGKTAQQKSWTQTENSILGVTTMLASAHPQGAVVGATATLDQSHLISNDELGAPLFMDIAHRFSVQVYRTELNCAETLGRVRDVINREKPAHTDYHLCILEPKMRVGYQARLGIDTVVAGEPVPTGLGDERGTVLAGQHPAQVGESILGIGTRVG